MRVAIIGAGITGLYLAWKLSERGHSVTVFEKKGKIGKEVCSGLFSQRILEFIPESQKLIRNQIDYCLIHFPRKVFKIRFSGKFFVMSHQELDGLVFVLAEKSGAKIILNHPVNSLPEGFDRIIGCDGVLSQVRRSLRLKDPQFYLGIQGFLSEEDFSNPEVEPSAHYGAGFVETWPTKSGFLWRIPKGSEVEYGIIEKPTEANPEAEPSVRYGARKIFGRFLEKNNINLERINSALIPQGFIIPSNSKITLCGDAAGLTKPWSGGGVVWGLIAANILLKTFPDFVKYKKETERFFLPKIIFSKIAKKLIYFLGFNIPWVLPKNFRVEGDFLA